MPSPDRPNILWVSFEDTFPFYPCYGDPTAKTPTLDRLAEEGMVYSNAFSTAGVCAPARSAVITGMYAVSIGAHHMRTTHRNRNCPDLPTPYEAVPPAHVKCFPEYLRAAGYYCTNNSKTDYQFKPPVTAWDDCSEQAHWRNRKNPDQPFFAVFNPTRTHESGMWEDKDYEITVDPATVPVPPYLPDTPKVRESIARMYSNIEWNDRFLAERLAELEEDGLADNTIVVHWSDHGPMPRGKRWPYDSGIKVPLIVRWPGKIDPRSRSRQMVSTLDLGPSMLSVAGVEIPRHMQGIPFLGDQAMPPRDAIFATRDRHDESYDMVRAVRTERFKYLRNFYPFTPRQNWTAYLDRHPIQQELWRLYLENKLNDQQRAIFEARPVEELYDVEEDPHEVTNLAADPRHQEILHELRNRIDTWRKEIGDLGDIPEAQMVAQWHPDGERPTTGDVRIYPYSANSDSSEPYDGSPLPSAHRLQLHCATQGASIAWTTAEGEKPHWNLYTGPLQLPPGTHTLRIKAIRIGYRESPETIVNVSVQ